MLRDLETYDPNELPEDAVEEFRGKDMETSLWEDGPTGEHQRDVFLSLIFAGRTIRSVSLALLWQDEHDVGDDLGNRITQSNGDTPYIEGRHLHYHVSDPTLDDAPRLLRAAIRRKTLPTLTQDEVLDIIEDMYLRDCIPEGLDPQKAREIGKIIKKRCVKVGALHAEQKPIVFDVRENAEGTTKIPGATLVSRAELTKTIQLAHVAREDVFTVCCADGIESRQIARELRSGAWKKARFLIGGFQAWMAEGLPTEAC